jgi:hypothetical protein
MRFGSQIEWILRANNMKATDLLQINQSLQVPLSNNTPTPTATTPALSSPTATPGLPLRAPALLAPPDESVVTGNEDLLLNWASVGVLAKDQWYVVTLEVAGAEAPITPYWTKGTTWRLPADLRAAGKAATEFTWQVQVLTGSPDHPGEPASPPSTSRRFTWR